MGNPRQMKRIQQDHSETVYAKEGEAKGALGILMTTQPEVPTTFVEAGGCTTRLVGVKGVAGIFVLGVPIGGGGTPSARIAEMGVDGLSPTLAISLLTGTPITGELNGRTWTITGSFKSVRGKLKFLANSSAYKSSISTAIVSTWFVLTFGSPGTSLIPTGSKELFVSNLHI